MRTIACVWADLETNGLGLPSRLLHPFKGEVLLLRVLGRAAACSAFDRVVLLCAPRDEARLRGLALPERSELLVTDAKDVPHRAWMRRARKWGIDGWRGGMGWTTSFDEECPPAALLEAAKRFQADAVVRLPSHAPFLDAALNEGLVEQHLRKRGTFQLTFCQAPPGLVGEAFHPEFLATMAQNAMTPRHALLWNPQREAMDPQRADCHFDAGEAVRNSPRRFTCESPRLWSFCERIEADGAEALVALPFGGWDLPREVLADPPPDAEAWERWLSPLRDAGDSCVTFGWKAPFLPRPDWKGMVEASRRAGAYGIAVRTSGEGDPEALLSVPVDVVTVRMTEGPGAEAFAERYKALQKEAGPSAPLLVLEYSVRPDTVGAVPDWWARWGAFADWACLTGTELAPPDRRPCAKLGHLLYVGSDGGVHACAEGGAPAATLAEPLTEAWAKLRPLRDRHVRGDYPKASPPCAPCRSWASV